MGAARTSGQRRAQRVAACWALTVIPLLTLTLGYLLLHLPAANRALWLSASHSAGGATAAFARHQYGGAAVSLVGTGLALLSVSGSLFIAAGLARRGCSPAPAAGRPAVPAAAWWP